MTKRPVAPVASPLIAFGMALGAMWLVRQRGHVAWYRSFHDWMDDVGFAGWVRNLDANVIMLLAGVVIWVVLRAIGPRREETMVTALGLSGGSGSASRGSRGAWVWRGLGVGVLIGTPMFIFAVVFALMHGGLPRPTWADLDGLLVAPFEEEIFYRGVLVFAVWRIAGSRFWVTAVGAALIFGSGHVAWTGGGWANGWSNGIPPAIGGVWYAWLARRWGEQWGGPLRGNIFVTMALHAMMNLSWLVMSADNGAVGGMWPNVARGLTIAFGVIWTLRATGKQCGEFEPQSSQRRKKTRSESDQRL